MTAGARAQGSRQGGGITAGFDIMTEAGDSKPCYWRVGADDLQPVTAPQGIVVSFCQADERLQASARLSPAKARKWALRETGESCRVIVSARSTTVYAAPAHWLAQFPHRIVPSYALLARLVAAHTQQHTAAWIAGFLFTALAGSSILVLYAMDRQGRAGKPQVTLNPDNVEAILDAFAQVNGIHLAGGENVLLFDNHDALAAYQPEPAYPTGEVQAGIGARATRAGMLLAALALCAAGMGRYIMLLRQTTAVNARLARIEQGIGTLKRANDQLLLPNLKGYARLMSLDRKKLFAATNEVWQPGSVVRIDATGKAVNLAVVFHTEAAPAGRLLRVASGTNAEALFLRAGKLPVPPGLQRVGPSVSGDLNALTLNYSYQDASADLVRAGAY